MSIIAPYLKCTGTTSCPLMACGLLLDMNNQPKPAYQMIDIIDRTQNQSATPAETFFDGALEVTTEMVATTTVKTNFMSTPTFTTAISCPTAISCLGYYLTKTTSLMAPNLSSTSSKVLANLLAKNLNQTSVDVIVGKDITNAAYLKYTYTGSSNYITLQLGNNINNELIIYSTYSFLPPSANLLVNTNPVYAPTLSSTYTLIPSTTVPKPYVSSSIPITVGATEVILNIDDLTLNVGAAGGVAGVYFQVGLGSGTGIQVFTFVGGGFRTPFTAGAATYNTGSTYGAITSEMLTPTDNLSATIKLYKYAASTVSTRSFWAVRVQSRSANKVYSCVGYIMSPANNQDPAWVRVITPNSGTDWFLTGQLKLVSF